MIRASIDLGTNTCLLLIAKVEPSSMQVLKVLHDESSFVRLGQGVDKTRELHPDAIARTLAALQKYADMVKKYNILPKQVIAVATATARDSKNGKLFFEQVTQATGFEFKVISGEDEARFMFLGGLLPGIKPDKAAVIDIGGGSTEFKSQQNGLSLQMGSVRFTERYLKSNPVTDEDFWACQEACDETLQKALLWRESISKDTQLIGVAGTVVNLASIHLGLSQFDATRLDGTWLTRGDIHRMVEDLKWRTVEERRGMSGLEPARADVILGGALILWRSMEILGFKDLQVSTRGLRYGVLFQ